MELFCQITAITGLIRFSQILNILSLMNYILTAERLGIEKSMWGFGTFHSVARQLLCKYLPEKCTVEGTDRAVNQNETTDWNREFEVIESEEELQMRTDIRSSIRTVCRRRFWKRYLNGQNFHLHFPMSEKKEK